MLLTLHNQAVVTKIWIVSEPPPHHPVVPVLDNVELSRLFGFLAKEIPAPDVAVRSVIVTPGYIVSWISPRRLIDERILIAIQS